MHAPTEEVWLRGNARPAALLVAAAVATGTALAVLTLLPQTSAVGLPLAIGFALLAGPVVAGLGFAAVQPRLSRRGDMLRVRLAPLAAHDVPLEFVECFFMGSHVLPDPQERDDVPTHRVGTLVMRVAERATAWQARPTFAPWGTWDDGAVVFDGRWCEPLSVDLARRLSARLVDAKRSVAERSP
ncbi:MAG: hypothetical protein WCR51_08230 [Planctomycetia bacterium]